MIASRTARLSLAALILAGALPAGSAAYAQNAYSENAQGRSDGPLRLFPSETVTSDERPATRPPKSFPAREVKEGILSAGDLGAVNAEVTGILDPGSSGLPIDMWEGTDRAVALRALDVFTVNAPSPARQLLARRLLLSVAEPPDGKSEPSLLELRAGKLLDMGATEDLRALVAAVPESDRSEALERAATDSLFVDGRLDEACARVGKNLRAGEDVYWQKAQVFCALQNDQPKQASFRLAMLREQGIEDPAFLWAAEKLSGMEVLSLKGIERPSPLNIAMLRATGRAYPDGLLDDAKPWLLRAVALDDAAPAEVRLPAVIRALAHNALSAGEAAAILDAQKIPQAVLSQPLEDLAAEPGPRTFAAFHQLAGQQEVPAATAEVLRAALEAARAHGAYLAAARLYAERIEGLRRTSDMVWFAGTAARALWAAGHLESAAAWFDLADSGAAQNATARQEADLLWPLSRLSSSARSDRWPERRMQAWRKALIAQSEKGEDTEPTARRLSRLQATMLSLFQATGDRVTAADWGPLWHAPADDTGYMPAAARWHAVATAASGLRVAETTILALTALDGAAPADVAAAATYRAVESLRLVGLEQDARRIALEAAIAAGL